jgi:hypothetical protein
LVRPLAAPSLRFVGAITAMPASWYFYTTDRGEIILRGRFERADGTLGDAIECIRPGETFMGLPYCALKQARYGTVVVEHGKVVISSRSTPKSRG